MISLCDIFAFLVGLVSPVPRYSPPAVINIFLLFEFSILSFIYFSVYVKVEYRFCMILMIPEFCRFLPVRRERLPFEHNPGSNRGTSRV